MTVFGILAVGSLDTETTTIEVHEKPVSYTLSADQLFSDYAANEVAADQKYKGQVVVVTGQIDSIGKDITDEAFVVIGGSGFLDGVQCMFVKSQETAVAGVSKGQVVTIKGEVGGKMGNVLLNNCTFQ